MRVIKYHRAFLKGRKLISLASFLYSSSPVCPEINEHETTHVSSVGKHVCFPNSRCRDQDERPETIGGGRVLDLQNGLHPNVMGMNSGEPNDF